MRGSRPLVLASALERAKKSRSAGGGNSSGREDAAQRARFAEMRCASFSLCAASRLTARCRLPLREVAASVSTLATSIRRCCMHAVHRTRACCICSCPIAGDPGGARERGEKVRADIQRVGGEEPCRLCVCGAPSLAPPVLLLALATRTSLALVCPQRPRLPSVPRRRRRRTLAAATAAAAAAAYRRPDLPTTSGSSSLHSSIIASGSRRPTHRRPAGVRRP